MMTAAKVRRTRSGEQPDDATSIIPQAVRNRRLDECSALERLTGWRWDPTELGDFLHRSRAFPEAVRRWREQLVKAIAGGEVRELEHLRGLSANQIRERLDSVITYLREIARILAVIHGTPDLGNKSDPVDELVYIILSRKTRESAYQAAFDSLKARFRSWNDLLEAEREEVEKLVWSSGLSGRKTDSLFGALQKLKDRFGACTLEPARRWSDEELTEFLCSLPEIQRKSAYCVMMYSMGRKMFPVDTHVGRILTRLSPFRELHLDLTGMDHKKLQKVLRDLVPPDLRYSLHVNLVMHGREICKSQRPSCQSCELSRFCTFARSRSTAMAELAGTRRFVDLFCGAGGMSLGFTGAGFVPLIAVDADETSCRTYRVNHPAIAGDDVLRADIRDIDVSELVRRKGLKELDVLVGAPPCQGFSIAGKRSKLSHHARTDLRGYSFSSDARNYLFEYMISAAIELRPRLFLMENVPGMDSRRKNGPSFMKIAERMLQEAGFVTAIWKMDAAAYGVPQRRLRNFLVASTTGMLPVRPEAEFQDRSVRDYDPDALPPLPLESAIFDLPPVEPDRGDVVARFESSLDQDDPGYRFFLDNRRYPIRRPGRLLFNHRCRYHNERDIELYELLSPGEDSVHAIERHGRDDLMRYRRDVFDDKYARLRADLPVKTIVSHLAKDGNSYVHPSQSRSITIREAARAQSFPDDFVFCGAPSDQWRQVGNAVPPALAFAIAKSFSRFLDTVDQR